MATGASTPAPKKDRITGSERNRRGSAASITSASDVDMNDNTIKALKQKVEDHNKRMREQDKPAHSMTSLSTLKAVYRRGAGAFSTSHRPGMTRGRWAFARVNAFLHLLSTGSPKNPDYVTDNDLLPNNHPKKSGTKSLIQPAPTREF